MCDLASKAVAANLYARIFNSIIIDTVYPRLCVRHYINPNININSNAFKLFNAVKHSQREFLRILYKRLNSVKHRILTCLHLV